MLFKGTLVKKNWYNIPPNEKNFLKLKHTKPEFSKKEKLINKKQQEKLLNKLITGFKKENINAHLLLYGSQLYYPNPKKDFDLFAIYNSKKDAIKINQFFGGEIEPILKTNILNKSFSLYRLTRQYDYALISIGLISKKGFKNTLNKNFNVPVFSIRNNKPPTPSIKRAEEFNGKLFWPKLKNNSKIVLGKKYWFRNYPGWLLDNTNTPIALSYYMGSLMASRIIYSKNISEINDYQKKIFKITLKAIAKYNAKYSGGKFQNIFVRRSIFTKTFFTELNNKIKLWSK